MSVKSCIYEGRIRHRRFKPLTNRFEYGVFLFFLDLEELPTLFNGRCLWSHDAPNIAYFRRRDHLGDPHVPLDRAVRDLVEQQTGARPQGAIRLLTHLRYFGYCFNPLSVYYCYDTKHELEVIVAEVHNTPWGDEHCYVLERSVDEHPSRKWRQFRFPKKFHVSPFMPMDMNYDWRCSVPAETLQVHINSSNDTEKVFDATLSLKRRPISTGTLLRLLLTKPPMTYKVIAMIYRQAFRLWMRGAPYYPHPNPADRGPSESSA